MTSSVKIKPTPSSNVSVAWPTFAQKLAAALETLAEDQYLVLSVKQSNRFIQFAAQGSFGIRVETTSNNYLTKQEKLDERQIAALIKAGWLAPTGTPASSTPEGDPDGSPNFFVEFSAPVSFEALANLTVRTFAEILRVPHPGFLQYEAFDDTEGEWAAMALPELGLKQAIPARPDDNLEGLSQALLTTLKEETGISNLDYDSDGDIGIRYGSAIAFVRLIGDPLHIRIYSPILRDVEESPGIFARLNDINANETLMRFYYQNGVIYGASDISAVPYVNAHVVQILAHFCVIADGMDSLLQAEFGGRTTFIETMPNSMKH
jgi:hypothetical protein